MCAHCSHIELISVHSIKQGESCHTVYVSMRWHFSIFKKFPKKWLPWRHAIDSNVIHPARSVPFRSVPFNIQTWKWLGVSNERRMSARNKENQQTHTHSSLAFAHHSLSFTLMHVHCTARTININDGVLITLNMKLISCFASQTMSPSYEQ